MSRLPSVVGKCQGDTPSIANYVNSAQRRLLMCREAGDEGWYGTFAELQFTHVSRSNPYITTPREVARLEKIDICNQPVPINNPFYEYLQFGNGRLPNLFGCAQDDLCLTGAYQRNNAVTFVNMPSPPMYLRAYTSDIADVQADKRVLFQGRDQNDSMIYTQDVLNQVMGEYVILDTPFTTSTFQFLNITGIQKDITAGQIQIMAVDPTTGVETLIHTMEPGETVAGYRRYYLNNLPFNCCRTQSITAQDLVVTAIAKLEPLPVYADPDYLLIQNLEAIIEECQAIRYEEMDSETAKKLSMVHHVNAIRYLQGELVHRYGKLQPAVSFAPFGSARLERQAIGTLM